MADSHKDRVRRAAPTFYSRSSRKYQSISPDQFEMERGFGISPSSSALSKEGRMLSPQIPGESTDAGSRLLSPGLDPMSPNLQDSVASRGRPESQIGLLNSTRGNDSGIGLNIYQLSTPTRRHRNSWLARTLKSKWSMVICLFLGVAGALGHHLLYYHLHGREATEQQWWLRLGQFLAFVAKASFVVAVLIAHQQVAWRAVGQKSFSVHAVDSLFGAAHDAFELFNKEAWKKSSFVMFLAIYIWASPFVVIFTSATLNVVLDTKQENVTCTSVRTLNFSNDAKKSWRDSKKAENETMNGLSLSMFNEATQNKTSPDAFDYWLRPSPALDSIASRVLTGVQSLQRDEVAKEICGDHWDCSTTIHFVGPGYKCQQLAKGVDSEMDKFGTYEPPFNLSQLIPAARFSYNTVADKGEYAATQIAVDQQNLPLQKPPFPKNLGAFRTEPAIWLGYVEVDDMSVKHANASTEKGWKEDYTPVITACEHWETNYTVEMSYTGGLQSFNVTHRNYMHKIINTTYVNGSAYDGTLDNTFAEPEEHYVLPQDWVDYRRIAAYHSLGLKLRNLLNGSIELLPGPIAHSDITTSKLIDRHETLPVPNFEARVRNLYENLLISLLSDPQLLAVAWASDPSKLSGIGEGGPDTAYPCTLIRKASYFFYHWQILVFVYGASFIVASAAVTYGIVAMRRDGVEELRQMTFSSIARATKRMNLDQDENNRRRIRAVEERPGSGLYEFRVEDYRG